MHVSGFHCGVYEICTPLQFYAAQISSLLSMFQVNLSVHLKAMGMNENNLDDERMPNYPVAYIVQIMSMRNSPHEQLVGVPTSPIMFQLSSKFFQVE
jgi:hypothetical protein